MADAFNLTYTEALDLIDNARKQADEATKPLAYSPDEGWLVEVAHRRIATVFEIQLMKLREAAIKEEDKDLNQAEYLEKLKGER